MCVRTESYNRNITGNLKNHFLAGVTTSSLCLKANPIITHTSKRGKQSYMYILFKIIATMQKRWEWLNSAATPSRSAEKSAHCIPFRWSTGLCLSKKHCCNLQCFSSLSPFMLHIEIFHPQPIRLFMSMHLYKPETTTKKSYLQWQFYILIVKQRGNVATPRARRIRQSDENIPFNRSVGSRASADITMSSWTI